MSNSVFVCRYRSRWACAIALVLAGFAWFGLAWRIVLGRSFEEFTTLVRENGVAFMPGLPELSLELVWLTFAVFGVAVPVAVWTRVARIDAGAGQVRVIPQWGRPITMSRADLAGIEAIGESVELRLPHRRVMRLRSGRAKELVSTLNRI